MKGTPDYSLAGGSAPLNMPDEPDDSGFDFKLEATGVVTDEPLTEDEKAAILEAQAAEAEAEEEAAAEAEAAAGEPEPIDFDSLPQEEKNSVLFGALMEAHQRLELAEQRIGMMAQVLASVLQTEQAPAPQLEVARCVPRMAVPASKNPHPTRNSQG